MAVNEALYQAVASGKKKQVQQIVTEAVERGDEVLPLLDESMIPAMQEVGDKFSRGDAFIPEMLIAARAMQAGVDIIEPLLVNSGHKPVARVCIGTVKGDLHDIGKNLVIIMMKSAGFEVIDLGTDCEVEKYRDAVINQGAKVVLASALLSTTMTYMKTLVDGMKDLPDVPIVLGGAPLTQEYVDEIGAHGYGRDASDAVRIVKDLLAKTA
ncbi:MAG: corrinoid protein [Candidatus Sumerlaeia bacterium]|nr:corrinoid protein [Candidatus Sumerlaeia bacterium]